MSMAGCTGEEEITTHSPWEPSSIHFQIHLHPGVGAKEMRRKAVDSKISLTWGSQPGILGPLQDSWIASQGLSHLKLQFKNCILYFLARDSIAFIKFLKGL